MSDDQSVLMMMLARHADELRNKLASGYAKRCSLCGAPKYRPGPDELEFEARREYYIVSCPCGCYPAVGATAFYIEVSNGHETYIRRQFRRGRRSADECDGPMVISLQDYEPYNTETEALPALRILSRRMDEHHISYIPEHTITVCQVCHDTIHGNSDQYDALKPDMKRKEWEAQQ